MPAKFKTSDRVYDKNARGVRMNTQNPVKKYKHYYLKNTSQQELLDAINSDRTTVYNAIMDAGHPELAKLIRRL